MSTIHPDLINAVKNNKLVVFAGSGTSKKFDFPDWKNLVYEILTRVDKQHGKELFSHFKYLMEEQILTEIDVLDKLKVKYLDVILQVISTRFVLPDDADLEFHKKIIQLTSKVITTNYDKCFEVAWGTSARVIHNDDDFSLWKLKEYNEYIFKIHGDIDRPSNCILFESQYNELYKKESFWIGLMHLLMDSTVLFIGFSMSDRHVKSIFEKISNMHQGLTNKHFLVTTDTNFKCDGLNNTIIPIPIKNYEVESLNKILEDLMSTVSNLPARPSNKFVGRKEELTEVMKRLKENYPVVILKGEPGIGKTRLAMEIGYACLQQTSIALAYRVRFINVIWIDVTEFKSDHINQNKTADNGESETDNPYLNKILDIIGRTFKSEKVTKISEKSYIKEWEVYKLLQENHTLLIIDNLEIDKLKEEWRNGLSDWMQRIPETCKIIITTNEDTKLTGTIIKLRGLKETEAIQLLIEEAECDGKNKDVIEKYGEAMHNFINDLKNKNLIEENAEIIHSLTKDSKENQSIQLLIEEAECDKEKKSLIEEHAQLLYSYTKGNPSAVQLAAGQIKKKTIDINEIREHKQNQSATYYFHSKILEQLSQDSFQDAKKFLSMFLVFKSLRNIDKNTLFEASDYLAIDFDKASSECKLLNILKVSKDDNKERYFILLQTHDFLKKEISSAMKKKAKKAWINYFENFVRKNVEREHLPDEPYWNALVSDKMQALKDGWNGINEVLLWLMAEEPPKKVEEDSQKDDPFINMVMWLVHYMDSRFYNQERLDYVHAAVERAKRQKMKYEEALFRIDALGWTYIEKDQLQKAEDEINEGIKLAKELKETKQKKGDNNQGKAENLLALGHAWLARVKAEQNKISDAEKEIKTALNTYPNVKPWIRYRVFMARGDVYVHEKDFINAQIAYWKAKYEYDKYNGEGQDYQIKPRLGLAYLKNKKIGEAKDILGKQIDREIPIGSLYAEFGLALLAYKTGDKEILVKLNELEREIYRKTSSNVLWKLIKACKEDE